MRMVGLLTLIVALSPLTLVGADRQQPTEFKGTLQTGIMAIGGETTGTIIRVTGGKTYELEVGNLRDLAEKLNGKEAIVQGTLRVQPGVEIKERRIITVTGLKAAGGKSEAPAASKAGADEAKGAKRQLLSNHETLAVFAGVEYQLCRGLTALCPKECGQSGEFASFTIRKYLKYEKLGQYGDPKQETFLVQVSDYDKKPKGDPMILETVKGLKKGDYVLLSWHHDYVTKEGASYPERPIVKVEAVAKEKAEGLLNAPAAKDDAAKVTGSFVVPKELDSFDGRVVEIQLFKYDPRIADKPADLVEKIEINAFSHAKGTETKRDFVIGAKAKLENNRRYYLVVVVLKDGHRTHWGEVPGKDLCKVLTDGEPRNVTLVFRAVR